MKISWNSVCKQLRLEINYQHISLQRPHARAWAHWPGHGGDVVPWEDTGGSGSQRGAFEPPVLALLCHPIHLPFPKLKLVSLLGLVGV